MQTMDEENQLLRRQLAKEKNDHQDALALQEETNAALIACFEWGRQNNHYISLLNVAKIAYAQTKSSRLGTALRNGPTPENKDSASLLPAAAPSPPSSSSSSSSSSSKSVPNTSSKLTPMLPTKQPPAQQPPAQAPASNPGHQPMQPAAAVPPKQPKTHATKKSNRARPSLKARRSPANGRTVYFDPKGKTSAAAAVALGSVTRKASSSSSSTAKGAGNYPKPPGKTTKNVAKNVKKRDQVDERRLGTHHGTNGADDDEEEEEEEEEEDEDTDTDTDCVIVPPPKPVRKPFRHQPSPLQQEQPLSPEQPAAEQPAEASVSEDDEETRWPRHQGEGYIEVTVRRRPPKPEVVPLPIVENDRKKRKRTTVHHQQRSDDDDEHEQSASLSTFSSSSSSSSSSSTSSSSSDDDDEENEEDSIRRRYTALQHKRLTAALKQYRVQEAHRLNKAGTCYASIIST